MDERRIRTLLESVGAGDLSPAKAYTTLKNFPFEDLAYARVDHHRSVRQGIPEVVFAEGKTPEETAGIAQSLYARAGRVLVTRCSEEQAEAVRQALGEDAHVDHRSQARCLSARRKTGGPRPKGNVLILTAGTSDLPVGQEVLATLQFLGSRASLVSDVGVAGIHRLTAVRETLERARVIVVVAGMEGALPSVVGGLTDRPLVAVPTSIGYGTSFGGLTALLAMLNSCVPGLAVVNIDNGFGAACLAHRINTLR